MGKTARHWFWLWLALGFACGTPEGEVQLLLKAPDVAEGDTVFVAGSFNYWNPHDPDYAMERVSEDEFEILLEDVEDSVIEFKFTKGGWGREELTFEGAQLPDRRLLLNESWVAQCTVAVWANPELKPVLQSTAMPTVKTIGPIEMTGFDRERTVRVCLPKGYESSSRRYPVLYMHDGQNVFDDSTAYSYEWGVDESMDSLMSTGATEGAIIVAIDNGQELRIDEYSPFVGRKYDGGGDGGKYVRFIVETLKPYIDSAYRTLPDRANTGIMGSAMGGVASLYAALEYPDVFSKVGAISPSFHFTEETYRHARESVKTLDLRIYMYAGGQEGVNQEVVACVKRMERVLLDDGHSPAAIRLSIAPDGEHNELYWGKAFSEGYLWLFEQAE